MASPAHRVPIEYRLGTRDIRRFVHKSSTEWSYNKLINFPIAVVVLVAMASGVRQRSSPYDDGRAVIMKRSEMLSYIEGLLQKRMDTESVPPVLAVGDLMIRAAERSASWRGRSLPLTPKEFDILLLLALHPGETLSRDYLFNTLWSTEFAGEGRLIDRHVMRLRQKLGDGAGLLESVWGVGYRLAEN